MKASSPRRRRRSSRRSDPRTIALAMRLPTQAVPVMRSVTRDPVRVGVSVSDAAGCARCFAACRQLNPPLQAFCQSLCAMVCTGRK